MLTLDSSLEFTKNTIDSDIDREVTCGILPVRESERQLKFIDALLILSGYCIATWSYTQGAYLTGLVGFKQLLITSFAGALLMLLIYQLPVILSTRFGIDIWIWLRAVFGTRGVKIVSFIIIVVNFPWYAVCCELFASSMTNLFSVFGIALPSWTFLGLKLLCVGIGTALAWKGVKTITSTTRILVPLLLAVGAFVVWVAFRSVSVWDILSYMPADTGIPASTAYILAVEANFAFVITLVGGMAEVPRLCKSERSAYYAGVLGQGLAGSFFVIVGAVMVISMRIVTGAETTDPTEMLSTLASPVVALASLLLVAFANIGTQAVGSYLYGVMLRSTFPKISYHGLISILGLYVAVLCVWGKIVEYFGSFLTISACVYAPLAALLFADFFIVRRQKLDFRSAYELKGHNAYEYTKGYNIIGIACLVVGCCISLLIYNPVTGEIYNNLFFKLTPTGSAFIGTLILYVLISLLPNVRRYIRKDISINPNTVPFDRKRTPPRQSLILLPFIWLACFIATRGTGLKIKKVNMEGFKGPFLVLGTHQSFTDFIVTPLALFPHRANYVSELEGFEYYGEWIYRRIGCLGTRKFVPDIQLVRNIKKVLDRGDSLVLYPEARYANVGTMSRLEKSVAKMVKMYKYPVVVLNMNGNYLQSPIWNLTKRKEARLSATLIGALKSEEIEKMSIDEIHEKLSDLLEYDEYKYQRESGIKITYPKRAEGLHKPLYKCMKCGCETKMASEGDRLFCQNCNASWHMDETGSLIESESGEVTYIPDWYEWERECVSKEIADGTYNLSIKVQIDALPNAHNFIDCGIGELTHNMDGFTLRFNDYENGSDKGMSERFFSNISMPSVHTEYDYRGKGECITLSTLDNTYFLFPADNEEKNARFHSTKIMFATEGIG